ncbi:filamentous hemagglutinin [Nostoc sp. CENA543]|uniref:two-partner secretion domain-containing protein n=1 Tax=Nostoc sp. CENA543 TaxID=1869241 RepID=UPI000CA134D8|nr:S-layer family protein [Nostoc sp. CENA543]AUT00549.1 filamentous hemagglutinin [Nostoc sp. CENA543]
MKTLSICLDFVTRISTGIMLLPSVFILLWNGCANAQITPDNSLNTKVTQDGNQFTITDGSQAGSNLFHSFSQFSVPNGGLATFDLSNTANITTIFSRVTGGQISQIDGKIQIMPIGSNAVSLFLLNPSGIVFGSQASLNISGSFVATTADSIRFADGFKFDASQTTTPPLLTMSVPVGLQLGSNAGSITVQGPITTNSLLRTPTLSLVPNQTLALVGSQINVDSANISASDGQIELWAVQNAQVAINNQTPWEITSSVDTANWGTITLQQVSLIDASGINGGAINIRGRGLTVQDGSNISSTTFAGQGKGITINTTDFVNLLGISDPNQPLFPGIKTSVGNTFGVLALPGPIATGRAGDVTIETKRLQLANGSWLQSATSGNNSRTGDVTVRAADVYLVGYENLTGYIVDTIGSLIVAGSNNQSGQVTVDAQRIRLLNGGRISSSILGGNGQAGKVSIRADESLEIRGVSFYDGTYGGGISSAVLSSMEAGTTGQGGQITIDTGSLVVSSGGAITSELAGSKAFLELQIPGANGTAGSINIRAKDIQVSDPVIDGYSQSITGITASIGNGAVGSGGTINLTADSLRVFNGGQITSSSQGQGTAGNINLQVNNIDVQGVSPTLVGEQYLKSTITASSTTNFAAGSVNITTDSLSIRDGAEITVSNSGTGDAGNLNINARNLFLDNEAKLRAEVNGGNYGNIILLASDTLLLRRGSHIITDAHAASTGGNININTGSIVAVPTENSDISANAVLGSGGNIQITTQGIFGLQFRDQLTPDSDITASSQFGLSGTVQVNTVGVDPNAGLVELPANVTDPSQQVATGCTDTSGSSFIATGRGGIPQNPSQEVRSDRTWSDIRNISAFPNTPQIQAQATTQPQIAIQATSWHRNTQGKIELIAELSSTQTQPSLTCAAIPKS